MHFDKEQKTKERFAIGITWCIERNNRKQFREALRNQLASHLDSLQKEMKVKAILSLMHKRLQTEGVDNISWTDYLLILLTPGMDPKEIWSLIKTDIQAVAKETPTNVLRVEILRPQNMPMFLPKTRLRHVIEYVVSNPKTKEDYYNDQHMFSGPVIQRFFEEGAVGSFIGLERVDYLEDNASLPRWDVVHITGFKWVWIGRIIWVLWRRRKVFHDIARKLGYKSAWAILRSWDAKRTKFLRVAVQDFEWQVESKLNP